MTTARIMAGENAGSNNDKFTQVGEQARALDAVPK